ncbi:cysteine desulfurase [Friedmanniella luteola]|uniref:cysteine desulfurase n=1 Tax=Friedmanniella luteola TaxID=546871 RepID=A0A1H1UWS5_9ACTN|nr:cysteine desulfurase family protein [Friedmanniella luteola]SDS77038.1 cysteine desulfurase [Friedmanniella luteola]
MSRIYLDHAATTPMVPEAVAALTAELTRVGNASAAHGSGRAARRVVEDARELLAARVGADPVEVIFTSGGTESDNLAVKGAWFARRDRGRDRVVTSAVEHHAVLDSAAWLAAAEGATAVLLPVDATGRVSEDAVAAGVDERTAVVSVMAANNEVGTRQPLAAVARRAAEVGAVSHSDAVQAVGHVAVDFAASGLDLMTFTAHKLGGPVGVGALLARRGAPLAAVQHGGGQERDVRSGTFDVAAVAAFAAAVDVAVADLAAEEARLRALRAELVAGVLAAVPGAVLRGTLDPERSLPGVTNLAFPGSAADAVLMVLDAAGFDCSAGSACSAGVTRPSHVLTAMGLDDDAARSSVRFSLGRGSTRADVTAVLRVLPEAVDRARAAAAFA